MSIYFQFPGIDKYPKLENLLETVKVEFELFDVEDKINHQYIKELHEYLSLKSI